MNRIYLEMTPMRKMIVANSLKIDLNIQSQGYILSYEQR